MIITAVLRMVAGLRWYGFVHARPGVAASLSIAPCRRHRRHPPLLSPAPLRPLVTVADAVWQLLRGRLLSIATRRLWS